MKSFIRQISDFIENFSTNYLERPISVRQMELGFDLGTESLKCALVERGTGRVLSLWQNVLLPGRVSKNEKVENQELCRRFSEMSREFRQKFPDLPMEINAIIQGEWTVNQYLEFPSMSAKELPLAVEAKATKNIPFPIDQINLDFVEVPVLGDKDGRIAVFVAAAHKESLEKFKNFLNGCGFTVKGLETPVLPLAREFGKNHSGIGKAPVMLVHSGFRMTQVIILIDGYPYYSREFNLAGRDFTYAFQMAFQASWEEAEEYKKEYDVKKRDATLEPFLLRWLEDIEKTWMFFRTNFPQVKEKLSRIYFSGGTSRMKNLDAVLSEKMDVPVVIDGWSKVRRMKAAEETQPWLYKIAVGLALS